MLSMISKTLSKEDDTAFNYKNMNLLGCLARIQQDTLLYLSTNPT